jgi:hypothetical protein
MSPLAYQLANACGYFLWALCPVVVQLQSLPGCNCLRAQPTAGTHNDLCSACNAYPQHLSRGLHSQLANSHSPLLSRSTLAALMSMCPYPLIWMLCKVRLSCCPQRSKHVAFIGRGTCCSVAGYSGISRADLARMFGPAPQHTHMPACISCPHYADVRLEFQYVIPD